MKPGDAVLVRAKVERVDHEGGVLYVDAHSDQYGWARPESLTTEAAIRADERKRVAAMLREWASDSREPALSAAADALVRDGGAG